MIKFTTTLYETNTPNHNKRVYAEGCFEHIDKEKLFPVFIEKEPKIEYFLCNAKVDWNDNYIDIETEPICNNWRDEKTYKALTEAFSKGNFAMVPCGQGNMIYDDTKDCYIIKDYKLTHLYITNQPAFRFISKMEFV